MVHNLLPLYGSNVQGGIYHIINMFKGMYSTCALVQYQRWWTAVCLGMPVNS